MKRGGEERRGRREEREREKKRRNEKKRKKGQERGKSEQGQHRKWKVLLLDSKFTAGGRLILAI